MPHTTADGQMFTFESRVQGDGYYASDLGGATDDSDETTGRLFPQVGVKWQYPWERRASTYSHVRSEEHTSELQSLMRTSYAVFCLKKKTQPSNNKYSWHIYTSTSTNMYQDKHT